MTAESHFVTNWTIPGTALEVAEVLGDPLGLRRWCPSVFSANHRRAMARGEESLKLELQRRRAGTDAEGRAVPAPSGPTFTSKRKPARTTV